MKKLVLPLLFLIVGFVAGYYFSRSKSSTIDVPSGPYTSQKAISQEEAQRLVDTFGMYGLQDANHVPGGKGPKTRSAFISLAELDSLCAALNAQRKHDGKTDGLHIYFGRYPLYESDGKTQYPMAYHNTLIFVSTQRHPIMPHGAKDSLVTHMDFFGSPNKHMPMMLYATDPLNRMDLCPNNCDGSDLLCPDPTNPDCPTGKQ